MPDLPALRGHLSESWGAVILTIHGDHRRALSAAVALQWPNTELIFECQRHAFRQLFCSNQHILQRAEAFGSATPNECLQERRRRNQERHLVLLHQPADDLSVERIRTEHHAHTLYCRQPEPSRESE